MLYKISRVLLQVCHQDTDGAVGAHLQHNSSFFEGFKKSLLFTWLLLFSHGVVQASDSFSAKVLRVVDGDTLWVLPQMQDESGSVALSPPVKRVKLRIEGMDAPEICQAHGRTAQRFLERWVLHETVTAHVQGVDRYGRLLARIQAQDGQDVGAVMVREGHAWSYRIGWTRASYAAEERAARSESAGLFAHPAAQEPRVFRAVHGPCYLPPR